MRAALLVALWAAVTWAQSDPRGRFGRTNSRCAQGRSTRGLSCEDFAFFEFAPANGAGMGSACACATPTGAKGEAMTFTRTGDATCSRSGLATTGIQNGDLTVCTGNQPRVEPSGGVLGLRVEGARTFALLRFIDIANALWADVGTPTLTGTQASPWTGVLSNAAVQMDDNDAAAQEGRSQTVTVTAAVAHTMHCHVKAGTLTSAAISLDGTTATITGLSTTSWSIIEVVDASSSGVAISAQILNGSTAAGTGTVIWGGCAVEQGSYRTSIMPTVASAVTRNAESPFLTVTAMTAGTYSTAGNFETQYNVTSSLARVATLWQSGAAFSDDYFLSNYTAFLFDGVTSTTTSGTALTTSGRVGSYFTGSTLSVCVSGSCAAPVAAARTINNITRVRIGVEGQTGGTIGTLNGIVTRVCVDPDPTSCR
jgi:hypothetical protein